MKEVLNTAQIEQFINEGYVKLENAFPRSLGEQCREILWKDTGLDPDKPEMWTQPVIRLGMYSQPPFIESANTPRLHAAFDELIGAGNWLPCMSMGTFPIRFPSKQDPGDTGWHVDVSFAGTDPANYFEWRSNYRSKGRALLMLFLYSDVGEADAPTILRKGSHRDIATMLKSYGEEGLSFMELAAAIPAMPKRDEIAATGSTGTVYLCHPFIVHRAQRHNGIEPKFMAQPPLLLRKELYPDAEESPLEKSLFSALK
jgi:hypothetical protein